jgi:histidyl-tRNA synthetase
MGVNEDRISIDLSLARGLDYYTGAIYETVSEQPRIGSLSGGGRFDKLIGQFVGQDLPAVGNSIGLERIITVMDELDMYPENLKYGVDVLICRMPGEELDYSLGLANRLRNENLTSEIYLGNKNLRGQLGYASDLKIPVVIIAGGDEVSKGELTLRNMREETQKTISQEDVVKEIRKIIGNL